ncbi:MAG: hypothetical protein ACXAD7_10645 [Candidatus Kariarchaeaceae archaeon]|jgi:hypothetical protein
MLDEVPSEAQIQLIASLNTIMNNYQEERKLKITSTIKTHYRSSRGSIIDNLKMVQQYVCSCGRKNSSFSHSTITDSDGSALDNYHLNCQCGDQEKISFIMMKNALQGARTSIDVKEKTQLYPYV